MRALAAALLAAAVWVWGARDGAGRVRRVSGRAERQPMGDRLAWLRALGRAIPGGPWARRRAAAQRARLLQALGALASELEGGQVPSAALRRCAGEPSLWPVAQAAAVMGGDVPDALSVDALRHPELRPVAACWRVAADSGAGLASAITRLVAASRAAEEVRVELEAQLAGPRATARTLTFLPLIGIGFGMLLGGDPLAWLIGTSPGRLCLLAGLLLTALGMWWTGRIAASVERLL